MPAVVCGSRLIGLGGVIARPQSPTSFQALSSVLPASLQSPLSPAYSCVPWAWPPSWHSPRWSCRWKFTAVSSVRPRALGGWGWAWLHSPVGLGPINICGTHACAKMVRPWTYGVLGTPSPSSSSSSSCSLFFLFLFQSLGLQSHSGSSDLGLTTNICNVLHSIIPLGPIC